MTEENQNREESENVDGVDNTDDVEEERVVENVRNLEDADRSETIPTEDKIRMWDLIIGFALATVGPLLVNQLHDFSSYLVSYIFWGLLILGFTSIVFLKRRNFLNNYYWLIPLFIFVLFFLYSGIYSGMLIGPIKHGSIPILPTEVYSATPETPANPDKDIIKPTPIPTDTPTPTPTNKPTPIPEELRNLLEILPEEYGNIVSQEQVIKTYYSDFFSVGDWELGTISTHVKPSISNSIFEYTLTCPQNIEVCWQEQPFPAYIKAKNFILYFRAKVNEDKTFLSESDYAFYGVKFRIAEQKSGIWIESYWVTYNLEKQYRPILINESIELIELFEGSRTNSNDFPISEYFKDYDEWNDYLIFANDSGFDLYVNGNLLDSISDTNIDEAGYLHFCFQVNKNQTLSVNIDNYVLWILPGEEQQ